MRTTKLAVLAIVFAASLPAFSHAREACQDAFAPQSRVVGTKAFKSLNRPLSRLQPSVFEIREGQILNAQTGEPLSIFSIDFQLGLNRSFSAFAITNKGQLWALPPNKISHEDLIDAIVESGQKPFYVGTFHVSKGKIESLSLVSDTTLIERSHFKMARLWFEKKGVLADDQRVRVNRFERSDRSSWVTRTEFDLYDRPLKQVQVTHEPNGEVRSTKEAIYEWSLYTGWKGWSNRQLPDDILIVIRGAKGEVLRRYYHPRPWTDFPLDFE